jgi:hypothetical protein
MKLLFCKHCGDVLKLQRRQRACECGRSAGRYLADGDACEITGEWALLLGLSNAALEGAARRERAPGETVQLWAWLFAPDYPKVRRPA